MAKDKYQIDMCHGPLFGKILMFALPLMLANMLQLLFHAADLIVVGQFSGSHEAVAAIGCTSSMYSFYVNIFIQKKSVKRFIHPWRLLFSAGLSLGHWLLF